MRFSLKTAMSLPQEPKTTMIKCPFCNGEMLVDGEKFTCFNCFKSGDIVDFLAARDNISHKLASWKSEKEKPNQKAQQEIFTANKIAAQYFSEQLNSKNYFTRRGLSEDTIVSFGLGYAPFESDDFISFMKDNGVSEAALIDSGLIYLDGTFKSFFKKRVVFPIYDEKNNVVGFGGRRINDDVNSPKYLNTPENIVFHKKNLLYGLNKTVGNDTVYLVEGYMDVIALHQAGITNAVAALGTAIGKHHCTLLSHLGVKNVILATDCDEPGTQSALKSIPVLREYFNVGVIRYENAKDPDEFIKKFGAEAFKSIKPMHGDAFLIQNSKNGYSLAIDFLL